jgi:hypothetical protein
MRIEWAGSVLLTKAPTILLVVLVMTMCVRGRYGRMALGLLEYQVRLVRVAEDPLSDATGAFDSHRVQAAGEVEGQFSDALAYDPISRIKQYNPTILRDDSLAVAKQLDGAENRLRRHR